MTALSPDDVADLKRTNDVLTHEIAMARGELAEAYRRAAASDEVLKTISRSAFDLQKVLDTLIEAATRLCGADMGILRRREGESYPLAATYGLKREWHERIARHPNTPGRQSILARAMLEGSSVQSPDVLVDPEYVNTESQKLIGYRAVLATPMIRDGSAIGALGFYKLTPGPFSDKQVELVETFADQAVIAIENARLIEAEQARTRELQESLEYQTATSEVLSVISRSPSELQPVLESIAATAQRLCQSEWTLITLKRDDGLFHIAASSAASLEFLDWVRNHPCSPGDGSAVGIAAEQNETVHIPDALADPRFTDYRRQRHSKARTMLAVPLSHQGEVVGVIFLARYEVAPFADKQVELVTTFADQALIAIQNARLFEAEQARTKELQESLEYQTATAEVLGVISRSPNELQPVLDAISNTAKRLCSSEWAQIWRLRDDAFDLAAHTQMNADVVAYLEAHPLPTGDGSLAGRTVLERRTIHMSDMMADPVLAMRTQAQVSKIRTMLSVPLLRENQPIGVLQLARTEVRPFTHRQIDLVTTFADQAVIAINNVGLFEEVQARTTELTEALEQQTATSEVLGIISSSPGELEPVFQTILQNATRICEAKFGILSRYEGNAFRTVALHGVPEPFAEERRRNPLLPPDPRTALGRVAATKQTVQIADVQAEPAYHEMRPALLSLAGARTLVAVPMLKESELVGVIVIYRQEVRPFTDKQIALVTSFARQAVIAIENARLLDELQARQQELEESLEQQTATSKILSAISSSPGNVAPVFEEILRSARELCEAEYGHLLMYNGQTWTPAALQNLPEPYAEYWRAEPVVAAPQTLLGRITRTRSWHQIEDARLGQGYLARVPLAIATIELGEARTLFGVPLLKEGGVIGAIVLYRKEVRPFNDKQIALLSSFADQAVIAIENARLLGELQSRTQELARSVEELRALGQVGQTVSSSLDLKTVLNTILAHACQLSETGGGAIYVLDEARGEFKLESGHNMSEELIAAVREHPIRFGESVVGQCAERREAVQFDDLTNAPPHPLIEMHIKAGVRALLAVPLLHQDRVVGALAVRRRQPGAFPAAIVNLMQTFANQSAIAVHNARLFHEIEEKGREIEIASQHKSQFVANMSHELRTPLAAMLGYAELLQENIYGALPEKATPILARIQSNGKHLLGLINTVLDISKIESGQFKLNLVEYAIGSMVETVRVATESLAGAKKLAFHTDVASGLPYGFGDEQRLTQVLLNLVGNAIKFTDTGEVRVAAGLRNGCFTVAVSDTGPGIPPEERDRVFEKFHQIDSSNTKTKGGTGLGLAIAKEIVEMHGGRIWVESIVGRGSTFHIELPVRTTAVGGAA